MSGLLYQQLMQIIHVRLVRLVLNTYCYLHFDRCFIARLTLHESCYMIFQN